MSNVARELQGLPIQLANDAGVLSVNGLFIDNRAASGVAGQMVVIGGGGVLPKAASSLSGDVQILARVFEKKLSSAFPDEFWGRDRDGRAGAMALVPGDWGPTISINLTFPISQAPQAEGGENDLWAQTTRELRGEPTEQGARQVRAVKAEQLITLLKETLADFASRLRDLQDDQAVTVLVYRASTPLQVRVGRVRRRVRPDIINLSTTAQSDRARRSDPTILRSAPAGPGVSSARSTTATRRGTAPSRYGVAVSRRLTYAGPSYVLQVSAADLKAAKEGKLDREALLEKIKVTQGSGGGALSADTRQIQQRAAEQFLRKVQVLQDTLSSEPPESQPSAPAVAPIRQRNPR